MLIPSSAFAQYSGGYPQAHNEPPECQSACYRLDHRDICPESGDGNTSVQQACKIDRASKNPSSETISQQNSWFSWIFDLFSWIRF